MANNVLLVGPLCAGKTKLAEKLIEKKFLKFKSNSYSIETCRRLHGDNSMSGELFAWANFLQQIESPPDNDNGIYEFSGTGRQVFNVSWAMKTSVFRDPKNQWLVVYCLAPKSVLLERSKTKVYDAPCPFKMDNVESSIDFMNIELKKNFDNQREWCNAPRLKFNMNVDDNYDAIANEIIAYFKQQEG